MKIHGSALEYTVKPHPERFLPYALEGIGPARGVLVGSDHTANALFEALPTSRRCRSGPASGRPAWTSTSSAPPGAATWSGWPPQSATRVVGRRAGVAEVLRELDPSRDRIVSYVGKLIVSKGVDLLLAAWPLVVDRVPDARLVWSASAPTRTGWSGSWRRSAARDLEALREIAARGRELEGGPAGRAAPPERLPRHGSAPGGSAPAPAAAERDPLHRPARARRPSAAAARLRGPGDAETFPESFGMVAAEAAACGALPLSANHSGHGRGHATLAPALPEHLRPLISFDVGPGAVEEIGSKLVTWLELDPRERERGAAALASEAARRYSWESVAEGVIEAASGQSNG